MIFVILPMFVWSYRRLKKCKYVSFSFHEIFPIAGTVRIPTWKHAIVRLYDDKTFSNAFLFNVCFFLNFQQKGFEDLYHSMLRQDLNKKSKAREMIFFLNLKNIFLTNNQHRLKSYQFRNIENCS